jgi:hypothetical protein
MYERINKELLFPPRSDKYGACSGNYVGSVQAFIWGLFKYLYGAYARDYM